jgi:hypothetical protein
VVDDAILAQALQDLAMEEQRHGGGGGMGAARPQQQQQQQRMTYQQSRPAHGPSTGMCRGLGIPVRC